VINLLLLLLPPNSALQPPSLWLPAPLARSLPSPPPTTPHTIPHVGCIVLLNSLTATQADIFIDPLSSVPLCSKFILTCLYGYYMPLCVFDSLDSRPRSMSPSKDRLTGSLCRGPYMKRTTRRSNHVCLKQPQRVDRDLLFRLPARWSAPGPHQLATLVATLRNVRGLSCRMIAAQARSLNQRALQLLCPMRASFAVMPRTSAPRRRLRQRFSQPRLAAENAWRMSWRCQTLS